MINPFYNNLLKAKKYDQPEVREAKESLVKGALDAMHQFFNRHDGLKGVWYLVDYNKRRAEFDLNPLPSKYASGYASKKFFTKIGHHTFVIKKGEKPSEALLSFLQGATVVDCALAIYTCYCKAILDFLGEEKFDQICASGTSFELVIGRPVVPRTPVSYVIEPTIAVDRSGEGAIGDRPLQIGDACYFAGVHWYLEKHPDGHHSGYHVIYMGNSEKGAQLFVAHGFPRPLTEKEIYQRLLDSYNLERTPLDELCIEEEGLHDLCDKNKNENLRNYYTLPSNLKESIKFLGGFSLESVRQFNAKKVLFLKTAKNIPEAVNKIKTIYHCEKMSQNLKIYTQNDSRIGYKKFPSF